jgi:hypothetical protein
MRYLFSPTNRRVKVVLFILLGSIIPAFLFHTLAYTTLDKKLYKQENWREIYGGLPRECIPSENPDMAVICGRALSGKQVADERGNYLPNTPVPNIVVELWEQNPISPTGKLDGKLTNLFASTITNPDGRFQLTMRKVGPPNKTVYLVFKCDGEAQKPKPLDSWHDWWNVNFHVGCTGSDQSEYEMPTVPYTLLPDNSFLGCTYEPVEIVSTGMAKKEQPTVNDVVESKNFDHRHTQNTFTIDLGVSVSFGDLGVFDPNLDFLSPGGWWEPDCLQKDTLSVYNNRAGNGTNFKCGIVDTCLWNDVAWQGGGEDSGTQPGSDSRVCDGGVLNDSQLPDRLTRPFYPHIPKLSTQEPYRRADIRANLKDYAEERYLGVAITSRLWGSGISDPVGSPHVHLRSYLSEGANDFYIGCRSLMERNAAYKISPGKSPSRNKYLSGGPLGGLAPASLDMERVYEAVINCDSTITDPTNPAFCNIRKPDDFLCNDYGTGSGRTEQTSTAIRFCEIQPPFGETAHCRIGESGCGGNCGTLGYVPYVLDRRYFSTEQIFANGDTAHATQSNVFNDSLETHYREGLLELFDTETQSQARTLTRSTRAAAGGGDKVIEGEVRNGQKGNSMLTAESIADIASYVGGTETLADPLTAPFTDPKNDYEDLAVWTLNEIGTPVAYCGVGDPFDDRVVLGPAQESLVVNPLNLQPDNLFQGNIDEDLAPGQLRHKAISTSTWYMSADAEARDVYLMEDGGASWWQMGLAGNAGLGADIALMTMPGRDVFDSLLSMLHGDARMHDFQIDLSEVITAIQQLSNESVVKTFGDRAPTGEPQIRGYDVEHPLSEENFAYIPNRTPPLTGANPNGIFVLPPATSAADATGLNGNTPDGEALMPNDWTDTGGMPAGCYPFNQRFEGEVCDSFREAPEGVSRTCRVDDCRIYYWVYEGTCTCPWPFGCTLDQEPVLRSRGCEEEDRLRCAIEQSTTERCISNAVESDQQVRLTMDEPPAVICTPNNLLDDIPLEYDHVYDADPIPASECNSSIFDWTGWDGSPQETDMEGDPGESADRCTVSRAGPMIGGAECNGTLQVGDFALRLENRLPDEDPTKQPSRTLDSTRQASLKLNNAFLPPFQPTTDGGYVALLNGSHNDRAEGIPEGRYTYGAEMETAGYGNYTETNQYSTAPVESQKHLPLSDILNYHCNFRNFAPVLRGEVHLEPYLTAAPPYNDPEMGTVDDNGDGSLDGGDISWVCPVFPTPDPEWVEYTNTSGNCSINDIGRCLAAPGVPNELPPAFFNTINMAANLTQTPAAIILAAMMEESGMIAGYTSPYWMDEFNVQMAGRPWYGRILDGGASTCSDNVWSAQSPYQILHSTFELYMRADAVQETFESLSAGRSNSASRCNFLDASILAGYHLKLLPGGVVPNSDELGMQGDCTDAYDPAIALGGYSGGSYDEGQAANVISVFRACRH